MKKILAIIAIIITNIAFSQTSQMEFNYANGGYIELLKLGIDQKEGYFIKTTGIVLPSVKSIFVPEGREYDVLKLERKHDQSIAAIMIAEKGKKPIMTIMDPKTNVGEGNQYINSENRDFGTTINYTEALSLLIQRQFWPDHYKD